ncbi:MAG: aminopeptidase [Ardenticatenaceae bacterium]|nr:aminopeptidase [Ardenticatenaceae bacterium]
MKRFDEMTAAYADLVIRVGLNLQPGQELLLDGYGSPETVVPFMRQIARSAYRAGSRYVDITWSDEVQNLIRLQEAAPETLDYFPAWRLSRDLPIVEKKGAMLVVFSSDPTLLADQNPNHISTMMQARGRVLKPLQEARANGEINWLGVSVPGAGWAAQVFPDLPSEEGIARLWETIFPILRLDQDDPTAAWEAHVQQLSDKTSTLTQKKYTALHFKGPGTDLTIGLIKGHRWAGGRTHTADGLGFVPNLPTEEVFTTPDRGRVDGIVHTSMPLNFRGTVIDSFSLRFKAGRVVEVEADEPAAQQLLDHLIGTDEGAARLGEVALVPHSSPISQSGVLFYNTLYDENAASHIALGASYRLCVDGADKMSSEEYQAKGGNESVIHVDFMIGSDQLDVDGIYEDGQREPVMRDGEWV